jgi:hypothetical protein
MPERCAEGLLGTVTSPAFGRRTSESLCLAKTGCTIIIGQIELLHYTADHRT